MKRLVLNIAKCALCQEPVCSCSYPYHSYNNGVNALLSCASFSFMCRQCEQAPCVKACPNEALERLTGGSLKRHDARCIECSCCLLACPFGAIMPQAMRYMSSRCDLCAGRLSGDERPVCVATCPHGALEYMDIEESESHEPRTFFICNVKGGRSKLKIE